ncbi:IS200/IS605 family transposase [Nostoc spongiaeforme FACHB-130]|uniref:IS200/IS605 family transposase n=1 Tax=Nostoc spongiaeforme FACHB-130 TaxID=1357510 RepID=A0ABR8FTA2_9NOSO|nr:IS200/IS605 family transposase [Nostoc spongiaeforme]MBD2594155.1 IS200/IS605 family transposase [Nostoc spongiaeforme FACHB-130]
MHRNFTQLYIHCVWGTWDRLPLVTPDIQEIIYSAIAKQCSELGCKVIAIGGIVDHVHLLAGYPPNLTISELVQKTKGSSSHLITHEIKPQEFFKWQGGYGAFTVSHHHIDQIANYIHHQPIHHQQKSLIADWEIL